MVKNLLNSGHNVSVWNRTTDKVRDFVEAGAKEALTPSDVIADSDITFSCVADPQAAKDLVFGNCGVLQEINTTKVRDRMKTSSSYILYILLRTRTKRILFPYVTRSKHDALKDFRPRTRIFFFCFFNFVFISITTYISHLTLCLRLAVTFYVV